MTECRHAVDPPGLLQQSHPLHTLQSVCMHASQHEGFCACVCLSHTLAYLISKLGASTRIAIPYVVAKGSAVCMP